MSGSVVKNLPPSAGDTRDTSSIPGQEGPLEQETAPHSSGKTHGQRSLVGLQCMGSQGFGHNWAHTIKHKERQLQKHLKSLLCTLENFSHLHHYFVYAQLQILHALYVFSFRPKLPCGAFLQPEDHLLAFLVMQALWQLSSHTSFSHFSAYLKMCLPYSNF